MVWQPGVVGIVGLATNGSPSMLYSILKFVTADTFGKLKAVAHVFTGAVKFGAFGNTTTWIVLLSPQSPVPGVSSSVAPQSAAST